jgi:hypothetical protein
MDDVEMPYSENKITLSESDLKELFALFTSATRYEKRQIYDPTSDDHFLNTNLAEEYSLTEEKREYALDAWRAVLYFLHLRGYKLTRIGEEIDLSFSEDEFID